jgi:[ribosomal protein S5]-alanine N-acetyltransferase
MQLETQRLLITPLTKHELQQYHLADNSPEANLKIKGIPQSEFDRIRNNITTTILPAIDLHPENILFHTCWMVIEKTEGLMIGDIRFKGEPTKNGEIEIGYGTYTDFQGKGFMTEAVNKMIDWAFQQENVNAIIAETNTGNIASHRILEKTSFVKTNEATDTIWWRLNKVQLHRK